jgi:hypothetical protein
MKPQLKWTWNGPGIQQEYQVQSRDFTWNSRDSRSMDLAGYVWSPATVPVSLVCTCFSSPFTFTNIVCLHMSVTPVTSLPRTTTHPRHALFHLPHCNVMRVQAAQDEEDRASDDDDDDDDAITTMTEGGDGTTLGGQCLPGLLVCFFLFFSLFSFYYYYSLRSRLRRHRH